MNKQLEGFDWGVDDQYFIDIVKREILVENVYEFITEVKKDDIVVDIGASAGPFTRSILHKNPKHVYCVEPSKHFVPILEKNTEGYPVTIINKAIVDESYKEPLVFYDSSTIEGITFKNFVESYNIEKIDFLKIDCEGGEYSIFIDENKNYLFDNVKTIAAEFHCIHGQCQHGPNGFKDSFRNFRDNFLVKFPSFKAYTPTTQNTKPGEAIDITDSIFDEWFIDNYFVEMMIYIDNSSNEDTPKTFAFHSNPKPALWVVDNFYDDPYVVREFALNQKYFQGGLGKGFIGKRSCEQFLFPGLRETFQKITGIPITRWEEHGMNGRFQSTIVEDPNVYHSDEQIWAGAIYLTPDAPYDAGTSLIAHKPTGIRHSSHPEAYKMWSDPNTYDIHLDSSRWKRIDNVANVFNRLVIWNAHCPHAAGEYFGNTLDTSRLIHLFFFD